MTDRGREVSQQWCVLRSLGAGGRGGGGADGHRCRGNGPRQVVVMVVVGEREGPLLTITLSVK